MLMQKLLQPVRDNSDIGIFDDICCLYA